MDLRPTAERFFDWRRRKFGSELSALNSHSQRRYALKQYGITEDDYSKLERGQDGRCRICHRRETAFDRRTHAPRRLAVDHDHATGRVRGLLCSRCNTALGWYEKHAEDISGYLNESTN